MSEDIIFDGSEDIEDWEPVDTADASEQEQEDYNDFDLEFVDASDAEEGDYWLGEYTGTRTIGDAQSPSIIFDNEEEEISYAFPYHAMLKSQVADTELSENQIRAENPVEKGESVAIVYQGTKDVGKPVDMHVWELRRPQK